jgi:hypothetical protein
MMNSILVTGWCKNRNFTHPCCNFLMGWCFVLFFHLARKLSEENTIKRAVAVRIVTIFAVPMFL